ncbi:MAG: cytochrome c biogenesis protein ResB [Prevotella sp.]
MTIWLLLTYLAVAVVLQWAVGSIDVLLLAFPVGTALGVAFVALLYVVENEWGDRKWVKCLRSTDMACWILSLTALGCIVGGSLPSEAAFQTSMPFVALLVALMVNLTLTLFHRLHTFKAKKNWTFMAIHGGLWLALFSGLVSAGDTEELNALVGSKEDTSTAYDKAFRPTSLPYSLRLKDFQVETNAADGSPTQYSAQVLVDGKPVEIAVNSPYAVSPSEDIYLMNFDSTGENGKVDLCVLMIERQPWKYPMLVGICMLLMGTAIWCININKRTDRQ